MPFSESRASAADLSRTRFRRIRKGTSHKTRVCSVSRVSRSDATTTLGNSRRGAPLRFSGKGSPLHGDSRNLERVCLARFGAESDLIGGSARLRVALENGSIPAAEVCRLGDKNLGTENGADGPIALGRRRRLTRIVSP